jgi:hypothetical protein
LKYGKTYGAFLLNSEAKVSKLTQNPSVRKVSTEKFDCTKIQNYSCEKKTINKQKTIFKLGENICNVFDHRSYSIYYG